MFTHLKGLLKRTAQSLSKELRKYDVCIARAVAILSASVQDRELAHQPTSYSIKINHEIRC